jgi:hypothetical protein
MKFNLFLPAFAGLLTFASCSKHSGGAGPVTTPNKPTDSMPKGGYTVGWQSVLGGSQYDFAGAVIQTTDGGYVAVGSTNSSNSGDVGQGYGGYDIWVVKFNATGDTLWTKLLGGPANDAGFAAVASSDGGCVIGGLITNTDKSVGNDTLGGYDGYIARLSSSGQLLWSRDIGTMQLDAIHALAATSDGGYVFAGQTDGYLTGRGNDIWLGKVDANGNPLWHKSLGGSKDDLAYGLTILTDGSIALTGYSSSSDGDFANSPFYGGTDLCVIKTDGNGNITWAKNLGGVNYEGGNSIAATADGGCVAAGYASSPNSGLVGSINGGFGYDVWLLKLTSGGDTVWTRTLGGSGYDMAYSVITTSYGGGGYALVGTTNSSNSGDVGLNHGNRDTWVVELDSARHIMYQHSFGGSGYDPNSGNPSLIRQKGGGGFIVATDSYSTDGDLTGLIKPNRGADNLWLFQLH